MTTGQADDHQRTRSTREAPHTRSALDENRSRLTLTEALLGIAALEWRNDSPSRPELEQPNRWGRFDGELDVRMLNDGRICELLSDYAFIRLDDSRWHVPAGTKVDGASIPPPFWSLIGGPFEGKYRNASVVHDHYCETKERPWDDTHRVFYEGMRAMGVAAVKAKVMYYAVYRFGPRWPDAERPILETAPIQPTLDDRVAQSLLADAEAIYVHDLTLEAIERLADTRNSWAIDDIVVPQPESVANEWAARARALVICGGSGTAEDLRAVAAEAASLPEPVIKRFEREHIRVVACRGSVTDFETELRGKTPRGWEQTGKTWDSVPGAYFQNRRRVVVATTGQAGVRTVPTKSTRLHGSDSLVIHECMHGFDYSGGHAVLRDPSFTSARLADLPNLREALNGYLVQSGQAGLEETFAESGARFVVDRADMRREWPHLAAYWESGITSTVEAPGMELTPEGVPAEREDTIGQATLHPSGTIELDLRAEGPGGAIGHAILTVEPDEESFPTLRHHLLGDRPLPEGASATHVPYLVRTGE